MRFSAWHYQPLPFSAEPKPPIIMKVQSNTPQPLVTNEGKNILILFDERKVTINDTEMYEYEGIRLNPPYAYESIVSGMITDRYSIDAQIAILANKGDGNDDHEQEYQEFEAFRAKCKLIAKEILLSL